MRLSKHKNRPNDLPDFDGLRSLLGSVSVLFGSCLLAGRSPALPGTAEFTASSGGSSSHGAPAGDRVAIMRAKSLVVARGYPRIAVNVRSTPKFGDAITASAPWENGQGIKVLRSLISISELKRVAAPIE